MEKHIFLITGYGHCLGFWLLLKLPPGNGHGPDAEGGTGQMKCETNMKLMPSTHTPIPIAFRYLDRLALVSYCLYQQCCGAGAVIKTQAAPAQ